MSQERTKPFFTPQLIALLVVACVVTGVVTYYIQKPPPPHDPHKKNPNVVKLRAIPKERYKPTKLTPEHVYMQEHVFPYIQKNQTGVKDCYFGYKGKFKVNPKGYRVVVKFTVQNSGKLTHVKFAKKRTQLDIKPILNCILKKVGAWKFPPHKLKKPLTERIPLFFR